MAAQRPVGRSVRRSARHLAVGAVLVGEAEGSWGEEPAATAAIGSAFDHGGSASLHPGAPGGEEHSDPPAPAEGIVEIRLRGGDVVRVVGEVSVERLRAVVTAVRQAC